MHIFFPTSVQISAHLPSTLSFACAGYYFVSFFCLFENIVPLDMKRCICHFTKWQIHPFISKGTIFQILTRISFSTGTYLVYRSTVIVIYQRYVVFLVLGDQYLHGNNCKPVGCLGTLQGSHHCSQQHTRPS